MIRHGLGQQVCRLLSAPQKYLQLAAVRVLRAIIGTKEARGILVRLAIQGGVVCGGPTFLLALYDFYGCMHGCWTIQSKVDR